ncbi:MAG TPA: energy transducer TonB [Edaphocola sp.]|nr:energy transducer TonB [Edaphocola sp.]
MKKNILTLLSLLLFTGFFTAPVWGQKAKIYWQKKMSSYYCQEPSSYIRTSRDSIISERQIEPANYVQDTLRAYFDYLWQPSAYKALASFFTYAVRSGDFWQCNDYYYRSKQEFRWGFFEDKQLTVPVGPFRQYYENGRMQSKGYFKNGRKTGVWEWFNKNGQLVGKVTYNNGVASGYCFRVSDSDTIIRRLDSLGAGYSYKKLADGRILFQGKYLSGGVKDSIWNHYDEQGRLWYTRQFVAGKQVAVICYDTIGVVITRDTASQPAQFKNLTRYLSRNVRFPRNLRLKISSGKIVAGFVVGKSGLVKKVKILQSLEPHFDYQVIHALEYMPKWKPAQDHGRTVDSYFIIPFTFHSE